MTCSTEFILMFLNVPVKILSRSDIDMASEDILAFSLFALYPCRSKQESPKEHNFFLPSRVLKTF